MRVVLDTNVLVSALLTPSGTPAIVLALVLSGDLVPLYDGRLLEEYREVLSRPRFGISTEKASQVLLAIEQGELVAAKPLGIELPDPDDLPFIEVAVAGGADAIVTGNIRHFPKATCAIPVLSPAELLELLAA